MPVYVYQCAECKSKAEEVRKVENRHDGPECCGAQMGLRITATMVQADIQPYRTVAIDKETGKTVQINSRREHREFLNRNDYVEVGNDFGKPMRPDDGPADSPMLSYDDLKKQGYAEEAF